MNSPGSTKLENLLFHDKSYHPIIHNESLATGTFWRVFGYPVRWVDEDKCERFTRFLTYLNYMQVTRHDRRQPSTETIWSR